LQTFRVNVHCPTFGLGPSYKFLNKELALLSLKLLKPLILLKSGIELFRRTALTLGSLRIEVQQQLAHEVLAVKRGASMIRGLKLRPSARDLREAGCGQRMKFGVLLSQASTLISLLQVAVDSLKLTSKTGRRMLPTRCHGAVVGVGAKPKPGPKHHRQTSQP
jgi:hypothetical protein